MIDFSLSWEQRTLQQSVRRFAEKEVRAVAIEMDRLPESDRKFPLSLVQKGMKLGFANILISEKYGGYGGNLLDYAIVVEELGYADSGIADVFLVNISLSRLLAIGCNETQRQKWLTAICEDGSGSFIIGGAMTEPTGGSEIFCPLPDAQHGVRTTAERKDGGYVLNGVKCFITNGGVSKIYIVLARTNLNVANMNGCSIFIVPSDTPGLSFGKPENKMGHRLSTVCEVIFEDVTIPESFRVGEEGQGFDILLQCYEGNGVGVGASAVGLARAAYDEAFRYARARSIWGQPISAYESVSSKLVEMRMKIEAARALIWKLAWAGDHPEESRGLSKLGAMSKVFPSSFVREVTMAAMEIFGGYGYMKDYPIEKFVRDAMLFPIYDGTNDLLKQFIGQVLERVPSTTI
jgi:alkylation response protein AidB-like acyl-CoA dehydrogenase